MRIAQVAPLYESVPPKYYGGTERVVSYLTEELVKQGHEVTLFAAGGSETTARLRAVTRRGLRLDPDCRDPIAHHVVMFDRVRREANDFDIIHFHTDYLHFPLARSLAVPNVTTMHGRLDMPDLQPLHREFSDVPLVSICNEQRKPIAFANWVATVYHGLPAEQYKFHPNPGKYLAFLGRIHPEKRVDRAVEIATRTGIELRIAAKIDRTDREYYESQVKPLLARSGVQFVGEITEQEKSEFLGNAYALLFPIDWPEPFGLVMIEALASGTPVIAWPRGSVPEILRHGETGYLVESIDAAVDAVARVRDISRARCRRMFEERFSAARMSRDYLAAYQAVRAASPVHRSVA
ncbi:MAG: glycosyltransferase family 4 protein [Sulfurifustaceae bacterium]